MPIRPCITGSIHGAQDPARAAQRAPRTAVLGTGRGALPGRRADASLRARPLGLRPSCATYRALCDTMDDATDDPYPGGRLSSGRFAPGHSGNPRGKPKGAISFRTRLRRVLMADPALMGEILTRMTMDATMDAKVALQLVQWHDGDNPDAFDKEQELKAMEASQRPEDVIGACLAALRQAGMHEQADALQAATQDGEQAE